MLNELRVGNIVADWCSPTSPESIVKIIDAHHDKISLYNDYMPSWIVVKSEHVRPLPLTEERLIEFGLEKINGFWYINDGFCYDLEYKLFVIILDDLKAVQIDCGFVHHFQNLTYYLTGKELTKQK